MIDKASSFFVVAYEAGAENPRLPTWANSDLNPAVLDENVRGQVIPVAISAVPGAFQLLNVLSTDECRRLIGLSESLGYLPDAAVSLPREIRHNDNVVWVTDDKTDQIIWRRVAGLIPRDETLNKKAMGLNARFRFYRYSKGDYFQFHTDGAWPGSRVVNGELVANAYPDRYSLMTFLLYLSDDYEGGETRFLVNADDPKLPARRADPVKEVDVRTPVGGALCFPHGLHPQHCLHSSVPVSRGVKYIIRTDVLFEL